MHWVIQDGLFSETGWDRMLETFQRFDISYSEHKVVPFVGALLPAPEPASRNVICMGSYSMRHTANSEGWNPGVFDLEPYDFRQQLEHWGDRMLNSDALIVRFGDVSFDGRRFVRPIHDSKHFAGAIFDGEAFSAWQQQVLAADTHISLSPSTLVQASRIKEIYSEARLWIVDGKIVTSSIYKIGSRVTYQPVTDDRTLAAGLSLVAGAGAGVWNPQRAFCLDLCDTPDGIKIVEINTLNSSGFYAADVSRLVLTLDDIFSD